MRYFTDPSDRKYVGGYGFLPFGKRFSNNIVKN